MNSSLLERSTNEEVGVQQLDCDSYHADDQDDVQETAAEAEENKPSENNEVEKEIENKVQNSNVQMQMNLRLKKKNKT